MATSYSDNLKIALQGTGDNPGTWGTITNGNLGTVIEQAIVGKSGSITISNDPLTPTRLSVADGPATSDARCLLLSLISSGDLSATRTLVVPSIKKTYIISNGTSGGQSVTVTSGAGTTVTVPNGARMLVYVDGTSVYQQFTDIVSGTTIGGSAIIDTSSSQTLASKTLTAPTINFPTVTSGTLTTPSIPTVLSVAYRTSSASSIATSYPTNTTTITIVDAGVNGAAVGDYVTISGVTTAIGGISAANLNKTFVIASIVSTSSFTVTSSVAATSGATGGSSSGLNYYYGSTIPSANTVLIGKTETATVTNKRISPRVGNNGTTYSGSFTPTADLSDQFNLIGLNGNTTLAVPSGTPTDGQKLVIRIKDAGVRRTVTLGTNPISVPAGSSGTTTVTVTDNSNGAVAGNYVTISGVTASIGGIPSTLLNGRFRIVTAGANTFTISISTGTTTTATGGTGAVLSYDGYSLTWNSTVSPIYRAVGTTLPVATSASNTIYVGLIYNVADAKWDAVAVSTQS